MGTLGIELERILRPFARLLHAIFIKALLVFCVCPIRYVIPKDKKLWVVVSRDLRKLSDNSKYFYLLASRDGQILDLGIKIIFLTIDKREYLTLRAKGYITAYMFSLSGLYSLVRARYIIHDNINRRFAFIYKCADDVEIWHGAGIKKIEWSALDSNKLSQLFHDPLRWIAPEVYRPDILFAPSEFYRKMYVRAFRIPKEKVFIMYNQPRNVALLHPIAGEELNSCLEYLDNIGIYDHVVTYLPTFRLREKYSLDFSNLIDVLENTNSVLIVKLHPGDKATNISFVPHQRVRIIPKDCDIYPLLRKTDILITDYSSVVSDFSILMRPIILYLPDLSSYLSTERQLEFDYHEWNLPVVTSIQELKDILTQYLSKSGSSTFDTSSILKLASVNPKLPNKAIKAIINTLVRNSGI